jgi:hypothetical protein
VIFIFSAVHSKIITFIFLKNSLRTVQ